MSSEPAFFTEPTADYWQELTAAIPARYSADPPHRFGYPVRLPDGRWLTLPLRPLPDGRHALASLIANQASFEVVSALAGAMADIGRRIAHDVLVGLPTLGLMFAPLVAGELGWKRYVPLGYSRKFWYDDALSEPVTSITSPEQGKHLRLDPNLAGMLAGRRAILVDDAISSGATAAAAIRLLRRLDVEVAGIVVAMKQTDRWIATMRSTAPATPVYGVFGCPMFERRQDGWWPLPQTQPSLP